MFEKAKMYYENGVWSKEILQILVNRGKLIKEEYDRIVLS